MTKPMRRALLAMSDTPSTRSTSLAERMRECAQWLRGSWKATHHATADLMDEGADEIEKQVAAAKIEAIVQNKLRDRIERLQAALDAVRGDPDMPDCIRPLSWLRSMIQECRERGPALECDDPDAYWMMVEEVQAVLAALENLDARPKALEEKG